MLLAFVLGVERARLITHSGLTSAEHVRYTALVRERAASGRPVAYLVGERGFRDLDLVVDERVLVPRPETEGIVDAVEARLAAGVVPPGPIVDRGTGSGNLALALCSRRPVVAVDIEAGALACAAVNVARYAERGRVLLVQGDGLAALARSSVAVVVANPPYVEAAEIASLDVDVRDHEPRSALVPAEDSVHAMYATLVSQARDVLVGGGWFVTEVGLGQARAVAASLREAGFVDVTIDADLAGIERIVIGQAPS